VDQIASTWHLDGDVRFRAPRKAKDIKRWKKIFDLDQRLEFASNPGEKKNTSSQKRFGEDSELSSLERKKERPCSKQGIMIFGCAEGRTMSCDRGCVTATI